jgi:hypothetical protein
VVRSSRRSYTGVCVIGAEPQGDLVLISVTANPDIESRSATQLCRHSTDISSTLQLVADFLREIGAENCTISRPMCAIDLMG